MNHKHYVVSLICTDFDLILSQRYDLEWTLDKCPQMNTDIKHVIHPRKT